MQKKDDHEHFIFNPFRKDNKNLFLIPFSEGDDVSPKYLFKKKVLLLIVFSVFKILADKNIKLGDRVKMLLYFFTSPKRCLKNFINLSEIYSKIRELDLDLLLSPGTGFNLTLYHIVSRIFNLKVISLTHGNDFIIKYPISFKAIYIKHLDAIILSNKRMLRFFKRIHDVDEKKLSIINRGIILKQYEVRELKKELRDMYNIPQDAFILISVGRLIKRKNFRQVIKAMNHLIRKKKLNDLKYFIIGNGPQYKNLKNLVQRLDINDFVEFLGKCGDKKRNRFLKLSDVFLMPSSSNKHSIEGFGITFLEANYYKLPVIGAYSGGIREAIIEGKTGFLINPNNLEDLISKSFFLDNNEDNRKMIGEFGHKRVLKSFNWNNIVKDYIGIFDGLRK